CERLFGQNLCQHGFAEMCHLHRLMDLTRLDATHHVLDLGCGNGMIAEYLSDRTGAHIVGIDFIEEAIEHAQVRTARKRNRLEFEVGDMALLDFGAESFDLVLAIDALYFTDLEQTVKEIRRVARPGGILAAFYSYGRLPGEPLESFSELVLRPEGTPLAHVLNKAGLPYRTWDYTQADYLHARHKRQIAKALKPLFEAEGNLFLYENHAGEAAGVMEAIEARAHSRYLYLVNL
ncbi:MAG: class I SAM-dependent methyltransferase, partial [Chloroflexi bacterium]|nr:class I SAM-dependent methyltransferase [Chloroflexota bacterium]